MYCTCGTSTVFWIFLDRWNLPLLHHRHIHNPVDILNLRHFYRNMDNLRNRDNFLYHFGDLGDVLLNDRFLPLDGFLNDFGFLNFDRLHLILNNSVGDNLLHLRHFHNPFLNLDFGHLNDLFDDLWPRHMYDLLHWPLNDFLLHLNLWDLHYFLNRLRDRNVDNLLKNLLHDLWHGHVHNLLNRALLDALLRNNLCNFYNFFDNLRDRHINDLLNRALLDTLLRNNLCNFNDFLDNLRDWHINDLLDSTLLHALLRNNFCHLDNFLDCLRHRNVDNLFDDFLNHLRHRHIDNLLHRPLLHAFLRNDLCHFNDLLHHLQDRNINDLLDGALLDTLLRNDLRDLYSLFHDLLNRPLNFLHDLLNPLHGLNLWDLLDLHHFLNGRDLDYVLADTACDDLLLVHRVHHRGAHDLRSSSTDVDRCARLARCS